jgi:ABC-type multidrug transport system ATPase subunit
MEEAATVCHRVAVLDYGRALADGTPRSLVDRYAAGATIRVRFRTAPPLDVCRALPGVTVASSAAGAPGSIEVAVSTTSSQATIRALLDLDGCIPESLIVQSGTLEDVFLTLTGRELREEE